MVFSTSNSFSQLEEDGSLSIRLLLVFQALKSSFLPPINSKSSSNLESNLEEREEKSLENLELEAGSSWSMVEISVMAE